MKWVIGLVIGLLGIVAVVVGVGMLLPEKHRASELVRFRVSAVPGAQASVWLNACPT